MALGATTPVAIDPHSSTQAIPISLGDIKFTATNVVGEASYTTGGVSIPAATLGLLQVLAADVQIQAATGTNSGSIAAAALVQGDGSVKLKCFVTSGTSPVQVTEAAGAANLSGLTFQIQAMGI
jgi:hypothetical protein